METLILNANTANAKQLSGFEQLLGETGPRPLSFPSIITFYYSLLRTVRCSHCIATDSKFFVHCRLMLLSNY